MTTAEALCMADCRFSIGFNIEERESENHFRLKDRRSLETILLARGLEFRLQEH
jgi:hypothetical protein